MTRERFFREIFTAAADRGVLLTATRRLGRHLLARYGQWQISRGVSAWLTPTILNVEAWLEKELALLGEDWRLLGPFAVRRLWEEVVEEDAARQGMALLQVPASAARAMEAHQTLADYEAVFDERLAGEDHRAFLRWRQAYRDRLRDGGWIDTPQAWDRIETALREGELPGLDPLLLIGFDDLPPRLQRLEKLISGGGGRVIRLPSPTTPAGEPVRLPCRDAADEVRCAARWARSLLDSGESRIGVVVPDLQSYRSLIERNFLAEIDPPALLVMSDQESRFGLSLGAPLAEQGPVAAALGVLACGREMDLDEIGRLLRSPYLGGAETEAEGRALFDRFLRSLRRDSYSIETLRTFAERQRLSQLGRIFDVLARSRQQARRGGPYSWREGLESLLEEVGWPGERSLDSHDYQVVKAWRDKLLPRFAALDAVSRPLSRGEAVGLLRRLAAEIEFQVEKPDPGLQVCGILEAGGLDFDHLWVLGLHENAWPAPPRPNPFIPLDLQVRYGMPHADAGREAGFAWRVTERLRASAPRVIFSHPLQEGDCGLRPSPLIAELPASSADAFPEHDPVRVLHTAGPELECVADVRGPGLAAQVSVSGGTAILRDQALCPFRAFARHRLSARSLDVAGPGLDPATRGTLAHAVLERFWRQMQSHERLSALTAGEREDVLPDCVRAAVEDFFKARPPRPPETILEIERKRLQGLLDEWLSTVENLRPAAARQVETEQDHEEVFGGLRFRTRVDRIDTLEDGRRVIIDYKTGRVTLDDLFGDRLLEPQLPVYAAGLNDAGLAGVAIGELRRGGCMLKGVARDGDIFARGEAFAGSRLAGRHGLEDWEDLLETWRRRLDDLGEEFRYGLAAVTPVSRQKACRICDLAGLCRIGETPSAPAEDEGELPCGA